KMMQAINWHDDSSLFRFGEDDEVREFLPKVSEVQEQVYRLSQDMVGSEIADQLQLRYWIGVTFFEDIVTQTAWDELESRTKIKAEFPFDITAKSAFNLLCRRPVMDRVATSVEEDRPVWMRLEFEDKGHEVLPTTT